MTIPEDAEVHRRLELLAAVNPDADATRRALERVRTALTSSPGSSYRWRIPMYLRIAASVLFLAGGAMLLLGWMWSSGAVMAFAEVQEKVQGTRTVTLRQTIKVEGKPIRKSRIFVQAPGLLRDEEEDGQIAIMDSEKRQTMAINPKEKKATLILGLSDRFGVNIYDMIRNVTQDVLEDLPEQMIDGKKAIGYWVRFGLADDKKEARVWVDHKTKLPVRVEQSEKDKAGHETMQMVFTDFVFDAPLDAALFRMTPPEGYKLVTMGTATPLPPAPTDPDRATPVVTPGVGIGPARFHMSKEEVIKALGQPDSIPPEGKGIQLLYFSRGFQVDVTPNRGLAAIHCVTQKMFLTKVNDFRGKMKEGIGMGASEKMIEQVYGKPDSIRSLEGPTRFLAYHKLGLEFTVAQDKLVGILVQTPPPAGP